MPKDLGISEEGIKIALDIKQRYREGEPLCLPGDGSRILLPEFLLNPGIALSGMEDPLPLAMMATRDPESPMAVAALTRLGPLGQSNKLISGIFTVVGETSAHPSVKACVELITDNAFDPRAIAQVRRHASGFIVASRRQYTLALRQNLRELINGELEPRKFVSEFFELTESGNLREDIRMKLVSSLLLSENIRPSIKFLFLENFFRLPSPVRVGIINAVVKAESSQHMELIKEELKWMIIQQRRSRGYEA